MKSCAVALCAYLALNLLSSGQLHAASVTTTDLPAANSPPQATSTTVPTKASRLTEPSPDRLDLPDEYPAPAPVALFQEDPCTLFLDETRNPDPTQRSAPITTSDANSSPNANVAPSNVPADEALALWNTIWDLFSSDAQGSGSQDMNFGFPPWGSGWQSDSPPSRRHLPKSPYRSTSPLTPDEQLTYLRNSTSGDGSVLNGENLLANPDGSTDGQLVITPLPMAFSASLALLAGIFLIRFLRTKVTMSAPTAP